MHDVSPEQARRALDKAAESSKRVRSRAPTMRTFWLVIAAGSAAALLAYGFLEPLAVRFAAWAVVKILTLAGLVLRFLWQRVMALPVKHPGLGHILRYGLSMGVIELAALIVGESSGLHGEPWFWIPAAVAAGIPLTVLAFRVPKK